MPRLINAFVIWNSRTDALDWAGDCLPRVSVTVAEQLGEALAAWRRTPVAEIAEVIGFLDYSLADDFAPKMTRVGVAYQQEWLAIARRHDPVTVGFLARSLAKLLPVQPGLEAVAHGKVLHARVAALTAFGPDPRTASALAQLVVSAPYGMFHDKNAQVYGKVLRAIVKMRDVRQAKVLRRLIAEPTAAVASTRDYFERELPKTVEALEAGTVTLSEPERARWIWLLPRAVPNVSGDVLEAAVLANPDDDAARVVYADWLLEKGDARGELIQLQMNSDASAAVEKRIAALVRQHRETRLGPLARVFVDVVFEKGFPVRATLARNAAAGPGVWAAAAVDPRLATLVELKKGKSNEVHFASFVRSPAMRSLRRVTAASTSMVHWLAAEERPRVLERLGLPQRPNVHLLTTLTQSAALPHLRELVLPLEAVHVTALLGDLAASGSHIRSLGLYTRAAGGIDDDAVHLSTNDPRQIADALGRRGAIWVELPQ